MIVSAVGMEMKKWTWLVNMDRRGGIGPIRILVRCFLTIVLYSIGLGNNLPYLASVDPRKAWLETFIVWKYSPKINSMKIPSHVPPCGPMLSNANLIDWPTAALASSPTLPSPRAPNAITSAPLPSSASAPPIDTMYHSINSLKPINHSLKHTCRRYSRLNI